MASSRILEAYLFDYEKGTTTKQFVEQLKKKCNIKFIDFTIQGTQNNLPLVIVVRCTTERAEEDLDAALQKTHSIRCPIIIVYFHMKGLSDCLKTENCVRGNDKYKHIPAIIDMDFSKGRLWRILQLRTVNDSAIVRLKKVVEELKDDIIQSKEKCTLYVYDKSKTDISKRVANELQCFMKGKLRIMTTEEVPCGGEPLLVIFCMKTSPSEEDELWKEFKGCDHTNNIMIFLYKEEDADMFECKGAPVAEKIDVKLPTDMSCALTYIIYERLLDFISKYHMRQTIRRKKTGKVPSFELQQEWKWLDDYAT